MKTLKNLFSAEAGTKKMSDFSEFAMNVKQMSAIRGGGTTEPINPGGDPSVPKIPPMTQP